MISLAIHGQGVGAALIQTHTNEHNAIQCLTDWRPVVANSARTQTCLHPLLACTRSAVSGVGPERGDPLHTPARHGSAQSVLWQDKVLNLIEYRVKCANQDIYLGLAALKKSLVKRTQKLRKFENYIK